MDKKFLNLEFNLVKFPIIFPLIYGLVLLAVPQYETLLIFFTILLLAESHFAATWPFFVNNSNKEFIKENKISLITFPFLIVVLSLIGFFLFKPTFLLIFFAANMYHVTRQSFGVSKLYESGNDQIKYQQVFIYIFNILFFLIGFLRFYIQILSPDYLLILNILIVLSILLVVFFYYHKFNLNDGFFTFITGLIIFYPICFVSNPVHAIIMGVTMHYTQYLFLTTKVYNGRKIKKTVSTSKKTYLGTIIVYATAMSILSLFGKSSNEILNYLIVIPIIGQMLHFYLDSQLWKFSNPHNRENVLSHIK